MKGKKNYLVYTVREHVNGTGVKNFTWNRFVFVFIFIFYIRRSAQYNTYTLMSTYSLSKFVKNEMFFSRSLFRSFKFSSPMKRQFVYRTCPIAMWEFPKGLPSIPFECKKVNADFESSFIRERTTTNQCIWSIHFLRTFYWKTFIPISVRSVFKRAFFWILLKE